MQNTPRKAAVTLGLAALVLAGSPAFTASASTPGAGRTVSAAQAAACFAGQSTHSGRTGTTYFTSNCADVRFRARVICSNAFDSNTNYGNIVQPTGKSSYECSVLLKATDVNGQYYNGTAWANLPF